MNVTEPSSFTFDDVRQVNAFVVDGSIRVVGTEGGPTSVEISEIDRELLHLELHRNGVLDVRHRRSSPLRLVTRLLTPRRQRRVVLSIAVPRHCPVNIWVVSAAVVASGLRGSLEVQGGHGDIALADLAGLIRAENVSGSIEVVWIAGNVHLKTLSGDVSLVEGAAHTIQVETHSGAVTVDNHPASHSDVSVRTHSGDVLVTVPQVADTTVRIQSTSGRIDSQVPEIASSGPWRPRMAQAVLGAGGSSLAATTLSGNISLVRHPSASTVEC